MCRGYDQFMGLLERAVMLEAGMIRIFQGGPNAFLAEDYHYAKAAFWIRKCAEEARETDRPGDSQPEPGGDEGQRTAVTGFDRR